MGVETEKILQELKELVGDELKSISYKWLARHHGIPADLAKQLLFSFADEHRSKLNICYLLAGWTTGEDRRHVVQLVDAKSLQERRQTLDPVTSVHVYSVQPSQPKDPADLWNSDQQQLAQLYDRMLTHGEANCLTDNTVSMVYCPAAKWDPELAKKRKPATSPLAKQPAAEKTGALTAKIDGIMAGATGSKAGVASASVAIEDDRAGKQAAGGAPTSAPAALAKEKENDRVPGSQKGDDRLKGMWKRAPARKDGKPPAKAAKPMAIDQAPPTQDASNGTEETEDDEEEDIMPSRKRRPGRRSLQMPSSDSEDDTSGKQAAAENAEQGKKGKPGPSMGTEKGLARASNKWETNKETNSSVKMSKPKPHAKAARQQSGQAPTDREQTAPKAGFVKAGQETSAKRRKVTRTVINDKGEEVTETVWESDEESPEPKDTPAADPGNGPSRVKKSAPASQPEQKSIPAKKPSPPKGGKKSAKTKGPGAGQKSLTSFFQKK